MKRPNPVNGRTLVAQNPLLVHTKEDIRNAIAHAGLHAKREFITNLGISALIADTTPSSRWKQDGRKDDFSDLLDQERGSLCLGDHTDDELAAELFIYGNQSPEERSRSMILGKPSSIAFLMAGKERIRWLSRHLDASLANEKRLVIENETLKAVQRSVVETTAQDDTGRDTNVTGLYQSVDGLRDCIWVFLMTDHVSRWNSSSMLRNDEIGNQEFELDFFVRARKLLPKDFIERKLNETYETLGRMIYSRWVEHQKPGAELSNAIKKARSNYLWEVFSQLTH